MEETQHYFTEKPKSRMIQYQFTAVLLGNELKFNTSSGVFSIKKIDRGTEVLIGNCIVEAGWHVLDMCCGYGPVGIALAKKYDIKLFMTDVNQRAVMLTRENIKANGLEGKDITVVSGSLYNKVKDKETFDTIIVNPPQTAGKDVCIAVIEQAYEFLKKGGILQLVARHNKGGKALSGIMEKVFGNVRDIAKKSGYRVYLSKKVS
ncbi:MAG: class I SAM-dependent methyltransferase [Nanoarchaeota archaeon]|nr:class I SAM-dependent methyltransferase [Nanoarchaeota archaeon]